MSRYGAKVVPASQSQVDIEKRSILSFFLSYHDSTYSTCVIEPPVVEMAEVGHWFNLDWKNMWRIKRLTRLLWFRMEKRGKRRIFPTLTQFCSKREKVDRTIFPLIPMQQHPVVLEKKKLNSTKRDTGKCTHNPKPPKRKIQTKQSDAGSYISRIRKFRKAVIAQNRNYDIQLR